MSWFLSDWPEPVKPVESPKTSTRPHVYEIQPHFIHENKTKGYYGIGIVVFLRELIGFLHKKRFFGTPYTTFKKVLLQADHNQVHFTSVI